MIREAIVLAGGFGTRLGALVTDTPKPMLPVGEMPFLAFLLRRLEKKGITRVVLSVGHLHQIIQDYFGQRFRSMEVAYCVESQPLGTGGAIAKAFSSVRGDTVFVLNGDTFADLDYFAMAQAHVACPRMLTVAVRKVEDVSRYGEVIVVDGHIAQFQEKTGAHAGLVNCGAYLMHRHIFSGIKLPEVFSFERDFLQSHSASLHPLAFLVSRYFIDIGIPADYARAQRELERFD